MRVSLVALQLAWWSRVALGTVVLAMVLPALVLTLATLRSVVWAPRSAGRRWPEGAGWGGLTEPVAALVRAVQREDHLPSVTSGRALDAAAAVGLGALVATAVVLPPIPSVAVADPLLGLFVLPLLAAVALAADAVGAREAGVIGLARARLRVRLCGVVAIAGAAVAVAAQWGSASLRDVAAAQAGHRVVGVQWLGLPTFLVQPIACAAALFGTHLLVSRGPVGLPDDRRSTGLRRLVWQSTDLVALLAGSAWVSVVFLGGGALPWTGSGGGAATVLGVVVSVTKLTVVAFGLSWSTSRWPCQRTVAVERAVFGMVVPLTLAGAVAALLGRFWF